MKLNIFKRKKNILVLGSNGMLGHEVYNYLLKESQRKGSDINIVTGISREDGYNFADSEYAIIGLFANSIHYDYCINCVAYTNTGAAEQYGPEFNMSYKLNALFPKYLAEECIKHKTKLIHISTDYVFSTNLHLYNLSKIDYSTVVLSSISDDEFPCNVYGMHKLIGELFIKEQFNKNNSKDYVILRTSWLYGMYKNKSFIHKFMKNVANITKTATSLDDIKIEMTLNEYSIPTSCAFVIECILSVFYNKKRFGVQHAIPDHTNGCSRFTFAKKILDSFPTGVLLNGYLISDLSKKLVPVKRDTYQPKFSAMYSSFKNIYNQWDTELSNFIKKNYREILDFANK